MKKKEDKNENEEEKNFNDLGDKDNMYNRISNIFF